MGVEGRGTIVLKNVVLLEPREGGGRGAGWKGVLMIAHATVIFP